MNSKVFTHKILGSFGKRLILLVETSKMGMIDEEDLFFLHCYMPVRFVIMEMRMMEMKFERKNMEGFRLLKYDMHDRG